MKRSGAITTDSSPRRKRTKPVPLPGRNMVSNGANNTTGVGYGDAFSSSQPMTPLGDASNINRTLANSSGRRRGIRNGEARSPAADCGMSSGNQASSTACTLFEKKKSPSSISLLVGISNGTVASLSPPPPSPSHDDHWIQLLEDNLEETATRLEESSAILIQEREERLVELKRETEGKKKVTETVEALTNSTSSLCNENKAFRQRLREQDETILILEAKLALKGDKKRQGELEIKQHRLLDFYHAEHCPHESGMCPGASWGLPGDKCQELKMLLYHIKEECSVIDGLCHVQHCNSSKVLLNHYSNCTICPCVICERLQQYIHKTAAAGTRDLSRMPSLADRATATTVTSHPSSFALTSSGKSKRGEDKRRTELASVSTTLPSSAALSNRGRGRGDMSRSAPTLASILTTLAPSTKLSNRGGGRDKMLRSTATTSKALRADTATSAMLPSTNQNARSRSVSTLVSQSSAGRNHSSKSSKPVHIRIDRSVHSAVHATRVSGTSTALQKTSASSASSRNEKSLQCSASSVLRGVGQFGSNTTTQALVRQQREVTTTENAALVSITTVGVLTCCSTCSTEQPMDICSACIKPNLNLLQHSAVCEADEGCCGWRRCDEMQCRLRHIEKCEIGFAGKCLECSLVWKFIRLHARECQLVTCAVPLCLDIKGCVNCSDLSTSAAKSLCSACEHPMQELLLHSVECRNKECQVPQCDRMLFHLKHWIQCKVRSGGGCATCQRTWAVIRTHSRYCQTTPCPVPSCQLLRYK